MFLGCWARHQNLDLPAQQFGARITEQLLGAHVDAANNSLLIDYHNAVGGRFNEHAHIVFDQSSGEYRLFNDRWYPRGTRQGECGIWIVRDGMGQEVHRDSRGFKLEPGDEIHFGQAVVRFEIA